MGILGSWGWGFEGFRIGFLALGMGIRGLRDEILDPWMGDGVCFYCLIVWNLILRYVGFGCIMR